jgi:hypothetical protein
LPRKLGSAPSKNKDSARSPCLDGPHPLRRAGASEPLAFSGLSPH